MSQMAGTGREAREGSDPAARFEARLAARTRVPASRVNELLGWDEVALRREVDIAGRVLKRFAEAVVAAVENPASADEFLRALDLRAISRDHDWRAIFSTLRAQDGASAQYKRAVLIRYLEYLGFRKRLLAFVHAKRQGLEETNELANPLLHAAGGGLRREYLRLPLGEAVELELEDGGKVELMLGGHLYRLLGARSPCLIDQHGVMCFLREGRNLVGRHPESDVCIDPNFSDVSRAHLIIEWQPPATVRLQDLSSRGTFVHREALGALRRPLAG